MKFLILLLLLLAFNAHAFVPTQRETNIATKVKNRQKIERSELKEWLSMVRKLLDERKINGRLNLGFLFKDKCRGTLVEKINNKGLGNC
mgnify:FL=1